MAEIYTTIQSTVCFVNKSSAGLNNTSEAVAHVDDDPHVSDRLEIILGAPLRSLTQGDVLSLREQLRRIIISSKLPSVPRNASQLRVIIDDVDQDWSSGHAVVIFHAQHRHLSLSESDMGKTSSMTTPDPATTAEFVGGTVVAELLRRHFASHWEVIGLRIVRIDTLGRF